MEPYEEAYTQSLKVGDMCLNRFCIDEDAAFELSGVYYLQKSSFELEHSEDKLERQSKDKGLFY